ncbi:HAD-IA family hydrolase [Telmatospirillum sp.]|uniref:HAD-IA family hydrolase n=1 Tax=Telmatospirillum sp. TaxID=2079197 RepID=UPI0028524130|nr:HAD-IA family hydrolase [Telmatospirillum sp.]MDR3435279.1 HAD-IA family hydrolase [Telmatospirillum sp.]
MNTVPEARYDAVLFDLLTALLDSWSLWNAVAGDAEAGRRWRAAYLRITYATGAYRPYEDLVAEAAESVGLDRRLAVELDDHYAELQPWPDVVPILSRLSAAGLPLGIVTNCSRRLGLIAARQIGIEFDPIITAEEAGWYKPDPRTYQLGLARLGVAADRCLFVAGSAYDLIGTARTGLPCFWHDRIGMTAPDSPPPPLAHESTLMRLPEWCGVV